MTPAQVKAPVRVVCAACEHVVTFDIPVAVSLRRYLAPIPCDRCKQRKLYADVPSECPTQTELPGLDS